MAKVKRIFSDEGFSQKSETNSRNLQCDVWSSLLIRIKKALPTTSPPPFCNYVGLISNKFSDTDSRVFSTQCPIPISIYSRIITKYIEVRYISTQTLDEFCSNVWSCQAFWFARHTGYTMCTTRGYMDKSEGTHTHWSLTSGLCLSYPFYEYFSFDIFIDFYSEVESSNLGKIVWIFPQIYPLFCRILLWEALRTF